MLIQLLLKKIIDKFKSLVIAYLMIKMVVVHHNVQKQNFNDAFNANYRKV